MVLTVSNGKAINSDFIESVDIVTNIVVNDSVPYYTVVVGLASGEKCDVKSFPSLTGARVARSAIISDLLNKGGHEHHEGFLNYQHFLLVGLCSLFPTIGDWLVKEGLDIRRCFSPETQREIFARSIIALEDVYTKNGENLNDYTLEDFYTALANFSKITGEE